MTYPRMAFLAAALVVASVPASVRADEYLPKSIAAYEAKDCAPVVEQKLDKEKIDRKKIRGIDYIKEYISESDSGEEYNFQGWVHFNSCKGNYVVNMNRYCQIQTTFTTGDCKLDNLRKAK